VFPRWQLEGEILKARRAWGEIFWALNENNFNPRNSTQQNYHSK
jgi:hypothetical protein